MKYIGTRLKKLLKSKRGSYSELATAILAYRKPRKNASKKEYNLLPLLEDGHNVTLYTLTGLMRHTGKPLDFFVDFEPGELPEPYRNGVNGNNNIVNSSINSSQNIIIEHLNEVIRLKNQIITDKERLIASKNIEIEHYKSLIKEHHFEDSDKTRT